MCAFLLIIIVFCQLRMRPETSSDEEKNFEKLISLQKKNYEKLFLYFSCWKT